MLTIWLKMREAIAVTTSRHGSEGPKAFVDGTATDQCVILPFSWPA